MESRHDVLSRSVESLGASNFGATSPTSPDQLERRSQARFPPVDEHLVVPELTRDEVVKGRKVVAMPGGPKHADPQAALSFLLTAHVVPGYIVASELLTRVSWGSDFATDVCIRKEGIDPETGCRYLEELSFEIVNEQRIRLITDKAEELGIRGVRRVIAIFVKKGTVGEWSVELNKFVIQDPNTMFTDPLFVRPIPFKALLNLPAAEKEAVRALAKKKNPAILQMRRQSEKKGLQQGRKLGIDEGRKLGIDEGRKLGIDEGQLNGRRESLLEQLEERFGKVPARWKTRVRSAELAELRHFSKKLLSCTTIAEVFQ